MDSYSMIPIADLEMLIVVFKFPSDISLFALSVKKHISFPKQA